MNDRQLNPWQLIYETWEPDQQPLREALTTLGNGRFATRGAGEESHAGGPHYPGTYLAGTYNRLESEVSGRVITNESLVNWPNWLPLSFRIGDEDWFSLDRAQILEYRQVLDLRRGLLERRVRFRDLADRTFSLDSRRLVHMGRPQTAAIEWTLTPEDWSGEIEVRSAIDGRVANTGVERYRDLDSQHLEILDSGATGEDAVYLLARTNQSRIVACEAVRTRAFAGGAEATVARRTEQEARWIAHHLTCTCEAHKPLRFEKVLALATSRDHAISEPRTETCQQVRRLPDFAALLAEHEQAWELLWDRADLVLTCDDDDAQSILRLHLFHILQTASMHVTDADVGIPARGLHGEAYRGLIFWDELFLFPFLNLHLPEVTRALLMYRYRRLDEARQAARAVGYRGAMYPWQSGSDGREESQVLHLNPLSGEWKPDNTHRQRHVNIAIAWNVWQYVQVTGDREFLAAYGAEMLLEIARFWASAVHFDEDRARYEIHGVVGPDEFHTQEPGSDHQGLRNNAYTNIMAVWCLQTAQECLDLLCDDRRRELTRTLDLQQEEFLAWDDIARRMFVPLRPDGIINQFEGWEDLEELDWEGLRKKHGDIQRLDRILGAEDDDPNRYQATKQADVLMLFYLLSAGKLEELLTGLGYDWQREAIPRNVAYYLQRTSHGSTLSRVVHAWVLSRSDRETSWNLFRAALFSDVDDIQGGTTSEGIHMGAMAGTVDLVQRCYTGLTMRDDVLWFNPRLPDELQCLQLRVRYRGHWLRLRIDHEQLQVTCEQSTAPAARIGFDDQIVDLRPGDRKTFALGKETPA